MGQDPREIRHEIERTRERMTDTVDAIGYRTDIKARTRDAVVERKDAAMSKVSGMVNRVVGAMPDAPSPSDISMPGFVPDKEQVRHGADQVKEGAKQAVSVAQANPVGLGVGAVAVGLLIGMALPATRAEDRRLGDLSDELKQQARDAGSEVLDRGKKVAQDAATQVSETVQESGKEQGQELADSLRQSAEDITSRS
jgi:gas vesicle protein